MADIVKVLQKKPCFCAMQGASDNEVKSAEQELELNFASDYRMYISTFGIATYEGHELTGICKSKRLNVVTVTLEERANTDVPAGWYVIEQANIDDVVIWQDEDGEVYQTMPNTKAIKLCDSLAEYIER